MPPAPEAWRYPGERPMFLGTLLVVGAVVLFMAPFTLGGSVLAALFGALVAFVRVAVLARGVRARGRPARDDPRLARVAALCRERLGMEDEADVFRIGGPARNAFAVGVGRPFTVAVFDGLYDALDDDELAFVMGHELGHVRFRHTRALALTGHLGQGSGGLLSTLLRRFVFLGWSRAAEYSADRAGLVACGRLDAALSALFKVGLPAARLDDAHIAALVREATERYRVEDVGFVAGLRSLARTHPGLEQRLDHLVDFAGSMDGRRAVG